MIILNADDLGKSAAETDAAMELARRGRLNSVSAMVFMSDSARARALTRELKVDVGLHLNFCEAWSSRDVPPALVAEHQTLVDFFNQSRYAQLIYNPMLRRTFKNVYEAQLEEFERLYGGAPTHIDGHRHLHLCANMVIDCPFPQGMRVRRNFTFHAGEKGWLNRTYRRLVDAYLGRRYALTDYFFSLGQCLDGRGTPLSRVTELAKSSAVEIMVHPSNRREFDFLNRQFCDRASDGITGFSSTRAAPLPAIAGAVLRWPDGRERDPALMYQDTSWRQTYGPHSPCSAPSCRTP